MEVCGVGSCEEDSPIVDRLEDFDSLCDSVFFVWEEKVVVNSSQVLLDGFFFCFEFDFVMRAHRLSKKDKNLVSFAKQNTNSAKWRRFVAFEGSNKTRVKNRFGRPDLGRTLL